MIELLEESFKALGEVSPVIMSYDAMFTYAKLDSKVNFKVKIQPGNRLIDCQEIKESHIRHALIEEGIYVTPTQTLIDRRNEK